MAAPDSPTPTLKSFSSSLPQPAPAPYGRGVLRSASLWLGAPGVEQDSQYPCRVLRDSSIAVLHPNHVRLRIPD
jgi:hypothetical protein